jgi:hypothetical protein
MRTDIHRGATVTALVAESCEWNTKEKGTTASSARRSHTRSRSSRAETSSLTQEQIKQMDIDGATLAIARLVPT